MSNQNLSRELKSERYQPSQIDLENMNSSHSLAIELTGCNKRVLEIGTSTGYITKVLKERGNQVIGVEIDKEAAEIARRYCESMIIGDVEELDLDAILDPASIDVILMGDILEHLKWPGHLLANVKKYLKPGGYLVVSLPNVAHGDLLLNLLNGDFRYTPMGLLDETHLRFFGKRNIFDIFNKLGYKIKNLRETKIPIGSTELRMDLGKIPPDLTKLISFLPNSDVYQFVFEAIPSENSFNEPIPNVDFNMIIRELDLSKNTQLSEQLQQAQQALRDQEINTIVLYDQIGNLNARNKILECEIAEINRSILWRTMMGFHNGFVERILPRGSKRRNNYDLGLKAGRILVNDGVSTLLKEYRMRKAYYNAIDSKKTYTGDTLADQMFSFYQSRERPAEVKKHYGRSTDIIICVHNALNDVTACLESIIRQTPSVYSLILVDDGSDVAIASFLEEFARENDACLIRNDVARGYTFAANQGLKSSKNNYVVLLNSDTIVTADWLDRMLECAESDERIGIVGPLSNTASWQSVPKIESNGDWASNNLPDDISIEEMGKLISKYSCRCYPRIPFLNGFCLLIKRSLINEIGYFDEDLFGEGYGEENDYCIRARKAQWELAIADDVYIYHAQSRSYSNEKRNKLCERAGESLNGKYGVQEVSEGVLECRNNRVMAGIRARAEALWSRHRLLRDGGDLYKHKKILVVLPVMNPSGGAYVILQEAKSLIEMGLKVSLFNLVEHREKFEANFPDIGIPVIYGQVTDITTVGLNYDVVVATINNSVYWIESLSKSKAMLAYYIQDFEPLFYPKESYEYGLARDSYNKIPKMAKITKTNWTKTIVKENLAVDCQVIGPSVDINLFRPRIRSHISNCVCIGAMIRPSTPRRNPSFTLNVLKDIKSIFHDKIKIVTFGCSDSEFASLGISNNMSINHVGVISRENLPYLFNEFDIFVDFSTYQAMGLTALEAMACGVAVIAPLNGGCVDYIRNEINGLLVDTKNKAACIEALDMLIRNSELREKIRLQSIFDACHFIPERAALNLLKSILNYELYD